MYVVGIDLGQHLGVALCRDGRITQAGLLEGESAPRRLCANLRAFDPPPSLCLEANLWLPGRKDAFSGCERILGAILEAVPAPLLEENKLPRVGGVPFIPPDTRLPVTLQTTAQAVRGALLGDPNASDGAILEWTMRKGYAEYMPRHKRNAEKIASTRASHVCDAILLALYGWDRLSKAAGMREAG